MWQRDRSHDLVQTRGSSRGQDEVPSCTGQGRTQLPVHTPPLNKFRDVQWSRLKLTHTVKNLCPGNLPVPRGEVAPISPRILKPLSLQSARYERKTAECLVLGKHTTPHAQWKSSQAHPAKAQSPIERLHPTTINIATKRLVPPLFFLSFSPPVMKVERLARVRHRVAHALFLP